MAWLNVSLDDLDANLFDAEETKSVEEKPRPSPSGSKRRVWLRKHAHQSLDDDDVAQLRSGSSSIDNSRRESLASSHGSPSRISPKRLRDKKPDSLTDQVIRRSRKDDSDSLQNENRLSAGARLYRVLEEQALGEAIVVSMDTLYVNGMKMIDRGKPTSLSNTGALTSHSRYQ
ncbi:uncharacterized protein [Chelonus insularis]|uniref:uncharacterized protein n=1 Tax=Chelonus insularis TaxID=460826 RepID=UPI001589BFE1|nr:uncharacterized protein LOC118074322 [Chelonus insularis]